MESLEENKKNENVNENVKPDYEVAYDKVIPYLKDLREKCVAHIVKVLKEYDNYLAFVDKEGEYLSEFCITYDGGNHPEYAANPYSVPFSLTLGDNDKVLIECEDGEMYLNHLDTMEVYDIACAVDAASWQPRIGDFVKWNDPAIDEYVEEDREDVLNRKFEVMLKKNDLLMLSDKMSEVWVDIRDGEIELIERKK